MLIGSQWSTAAENIRIGTGHLGSRVNRLPMERYSMWVFVVDVALFWFVAVAYRLWFLKDKHFSLGNPSTRDFV